KLSNEPYALTLRSRRGTEETISIPRESGRHSGADRRMTDALFRSGGAPSKDLADLPSSHGGALAVAIGDAVVRSFRSSEPVRVDRLLTL
ncbi:MAG TPA: hypothetical protein VM686_35950, partial [Polyangiaceae bacterium]|nr:hypothetical protein [Polyangiaceae bacterium]